jgi:pyruvate,water dikinase
MDFSPLYSLEQIQPDNRHQVGEKAYHLGVLLQKGYPVIPGQVVAIQVFRQFWETIQWPEPLLADLPHSSLHVDVDNPRQLQAIAQHMQQAILSTELAADWLDDLMQAARQWKVSAVILRPSLSFGSKADPKWIRRVRGLWGAWVGPLEREAITHGIRSLWARGFQARSLMYWQRQGIQLQRLGVAVLVQPIEDAIASGEVYVDRDHLEIQSIRGLGTALVHGIASPDHYHLPFYPPTPEPDQIGHQVYYHELPADLSVLVDVPTPDAPSVTSAGFLNLATLPAEFKEQPNLLAEQVNQLAHLARTLQAELETDFTLEWTIPGHPLDRSLESSAVWITQLVPHLTSHRSPVPAIEYPPGRQVKVSATAQSNSPAEAPDLTSSSSVSLAVEPLMGLAASPGKTLAPAWIAQDMTDLGKMPEGVVLVVAAIEPDHIPWLRQAAAIVTHRGGMTSHGAIVARELGLPAVVGVSAATEVIQPGEVLFVDGDRGLVYRLGQQEVTPELSSQWLPASDQAVVGQSTSAPLPSPRCATQLMVNFSHTESLEAIAALPVDGVGLLRSEILLRDLLPIWTGGGHDRRENLIAAIANRIAQFAAAFSPRPVFYRSLDLHTPEQPTAANQVSSGETNSALGIHGTLSYCLDATLFELELAALRRVQLSGYANLRLLLPFVRTVEEFQFCRQLVVQAGLTTNPLFQLWIMAEVPSILFLLPDYVEAGVQGISIGSNDLAQLLLAVDRDHPQISSLVEAHHPAVLRAMQQLINQARQAGIPCSICGQAPAQSPDLVASLVRWGIQAISVSPDAIAHTACRIHQAEQAMLLDAVRQLSG